MKKVIINLLLAFGLLQNGMAQQSVVDVTILGLEKDTVVIEFNPLSNSNNYQDTIVTEGGNFIYKTIVDKPTLIFIKPQKALAYITPAKKYYTPQSKRISMVLLPNDTTIIDGVLSKYSLSYSVKGAAINTEMNQHHKQELNKRIEYFKLESRIDSLFSLGQVQNVNPLMEDLQEFKIGFRESATNFIKDNPDKDYAALLLASSNNRDFFGTYVNTLSEKVKNGVFKDILQERMDLYKSSHNAKKMVPGVKAPEFNATDIMNKSFVLAEKQGKYVLLDFWGSWCVPCVKGFPKMKEYYEKYKAKVEFVSIACNDKEEVWKATVAKYDLKWAQLLNNEKSGNNIAGIYGVSQFPTKILLDPSGTIILNSIGEEEGFYKKLDEILRTF